MRCTAAEAASPNGSNAARPAATRSATSSAGPSASTTTYRWGSVAAMWVSSRRTRTCSSPTSPDAGGTSPLGARSSSTETSGPQSPGGPHGEVSPAREDPTRPSRRRTGPTARPRTGRRRPGRPPRARGGRRARPGRPRSPPRPAPARARPDSDASRRAAVQRSRSAAPPSSATTVWPAPAAGSPGGRPARRPPRRCLRPPPDTGALAGLAPAQRGEEIGQHRSGAPVVHLAIGDRADGRRDQTTGEHDDARAVDRERPDVGVATNPTITGTSESEPSSVSRTIVWTNALTRPRISSATCVPMIVRPVRNAMPANAADQHHRRDGEEQVRGERDEHQRETRRDDARAEQAVVRDAPGHPRRGTHAERQPDEDRCEQDAIGGVAAAEALRVERGRADDDAAGREGADDAR